MNAIGSVIWVESATGAPPGPAITRSIAIACGSCVPGGNPLWVRIVEIYCPKCGTQLETEYLPPGHPLTWDIEIDIDALKARLQSGELRIKDRRLEVAE